MKAILSFLVALFMGIFLSSGLDDTPINQLQLIGSHNSYKEAIDPALYKLIFMRDSNSAKHIDYSHIGLTAQLNLGLRNLEIDIYADTQGGKYTHPKGLDWAPDQKAFDVQGLMREPGFKVLHVQDIDFRSNCPTLKLCLQELKQWSDANPSHAPIIITMNAKDDTLKIPGASVPEKFTASVLNDLDKAVVAGVGLAKIITPDVIRGSHKTLETAVLKGNWPKLKDAKGKFIFVLDETGEKRAAYIDGHPSLKHRVLFTNSDAGTSEAAILIMNDPVKLGSKITELVKKGYIVRTRADAETIQARNNDKSQFEAALKSGAQIITTDYYQRSTHFKSDYSISFDDGSYFRKNPLFK